MYDIKEKKVLAIGCDQSGVRLKTEILNFLKNDITMNQIIGEVIDFGTQDDRTMVDYPKYAKAVCEAIKRGEASIGILIGGMGVEMAMAANRFNGIRAVATQDFGVIHISRETMDINILCIGARVAPTRQQIIMMIKAFVQVDFQPAGRHTRRIQMLDEIPEIASNTNQIITDDSLLDDEDAESNRKIKSEITSMVFSVKD